MVRPSLATAVVFLLCACASRPEPAPPSLTDPAKASVDPASSAAASAASADPEGAGGGEERHRGRQRKPFPIHSSCAEVTTIAFGDDPKAAAAGKRTVAPNSSIDGPRDAEGKQTVTLLDDKGEPIATVHITRGMKQLEIGRSCRTLDAR